MTTGQAAEPLPEEVQAPRALDFLRRFVQGDLASLRVFVVLAVIWIIFQSQNSNFLTAINLTNLFLQITAVGLISVGIVFVLLLGEIDLSVGAVSGLASAAMAVVSVKHGWNGYAAIAAALCVGAATGTVNLTDPAITNLANKFLADWLGWTVAVVAIAALALTALNERRLRAAA